MVRSKASSEVSAAAVSAAQSAAAEQCARHGASCREHDVDACAAAVHVSSLGSPP